MQASFSNKLFVNQHLSSDGTTIRVEGTKIKKKNCSSIFKTISIIGTVTTLELKSCRLKKLPAELGLLTGLRVLKIEDNLLSEVPSLETLTELTEVSFSANQLKLFPTTLVKLDKLSTLDLSHNPIACIPGAVAQITSLTNLRVDDTALPYFPVSICPLGKIVELCCGSNKFGSFPEQVLQFTDMRTLVLSGNNMPTISADIGKLFNLTHLDFSYNTIMTLPNELCTLTRLRTLFLQHNKLTQVPQDIGNLTNLTSLKLHDNMIGTLPESIGKLINLVDLYLQENEFSTLPPEIGTCTSIRTLRLAYNKLTSLPDTLARLAKLNVLMLHDNFLGEIPRALAQPQFLKHLLRVTLHNNPFAESIQNDITTMGALHFLQENFAETSPTTQRKQFRDHSLRREGRNQSRSLIQRQHNRVPGLKSSNGGSSASSANSDQSNDSSAENEEGGRKTPAKEQGSIVSMLKVQARSRRAISVGEALPPPSPADSDSDSDNEFRPWKSQMEIRIRSGSVPNANAPIPPYRSFQRVYEYLVDQLDLSEKRKEQTNSLSSEEKWRLLSNLSRESSLNLLVNTKPKSTPSTPTLSPVSPSTRSPQLPPLSLLSVSSPTPSVSPQKSPRPPVFLSPSLRSPSVGNLQVPRHTYSADNIRGTRELLTTQSVAWITTFAETGGIEQILHGLENLSNKKNKTEDDYTMILEYLSCITIMIGIGLESLLISNAVEIMVLNIDSENLIVKEATIQVLDEVCNVFYSGQGLVIDALSKMCKDESKRFLPLYSPLTSTTGPMAMKSACMKLINNLITNTDDLEARCVIRNSFIGLGLNDTLENLRASSGEEYQRLEQQIDHFEEVMSDDAEELALRFKEGQVDIKNLTMFTTSRTPLARQGSASGLTTQYLRVVLPSVSHRNMSCMIAQYPCDQNTTALDVVRSLIKEHSRLMGLDAATSQDHAGDYGLWQMAHSLQDAVADVDDKVDLSAGAFLEDTHKMLLLAKEANLILDLRLRPWRVTIAVDKSVSDLMARTPKAQGPGGVKPLPVVPETQMEVEPKSTCGAVMLQVLRKLYGDKSYEMEELAFYMQPEKKVPDRTNKATSGIWLESTAKLSDYGIEVTKTKLQLKRMPKILKIISVTDDSFEYVGYDEDTLIRTILQDTFQRIVAPSLGQNRVNSPSHYGLFYTNEETNVGEWLDPEKSLRSYEFPNRVPLRYLLKPKSLKIRYTPPESFKGELPKIENPQLVHFYVPIGDVLSKLGISMEGCGVYLVTEAAGDQYLDVNLSLFNQNVPENSTIIVKPASKGDAQVAASVHIWEEPENATTILYNVESFNEIHAATVNKLVERLTSEKDHDSDFTQVFEATYRTFMTHETLFAKLVERYIPPEHIVHPALNLVRLRVIVFLKNWLEHSSSELPQAVMLNIEKFIDSQLCKGGHMNLAAQLKKMIQVWKAHHVETVREPPEMNYQMSNPTKIIHGFSSLVDEWGLALQMTIRESKLFAQIKPVEFFNNKANDPIVSQMINNFNRVAAWVPVAILSEIKLVHRANAVERFIKLAWNLRQLNNFHLLTAVLSGMSNSAVLRLKWTWSKVAKRYKQMLEELEAVMAMEGSFKAYRNILHAATPPCVPYIGVYLTDLVFIEDGNPNKIGNMVNWTKRRLMYNIISTFQRYQLAQYDDKQPSPASPTHSSSNGSMFSDNKEANINTFLTFLNRMPILSDKQLYEMSLAREPRNCERRELM